MEKANDSAHDKMPARAKARPCGLPGRWYRWTRAFWRFAFFFTMRVKTRGLEHVPAGGGVILAVTHRSHLDPVAVSTLLEREISWMARVEFYRHGVARAFMDAVGAFPVDRLRPGIGPLREAAWRLSFGHVVGIFPEGEIQTGAQRVTHGGPIKGGAVYLAALTGCPVLPVLISGTEALSSPWPWMPAKWGRLCLFVGEPLFFDPSCQRRADRALAVARLCESFRRLHREGMSEGNSSGGGIK